MKKSIRLFILSFFAGFFNTAVAQPFSFEKLYSHDVMTTDGVARLLNNNDSAFFLLAGNAAIGGVGDGETVALKIDSSGTVIQSLIMGKPMYHDVCIETMRLGNEIYFTGYTRSIDTGASPLFTSFLVKTDNDLNVIWQHNFIFPGNDLFFKTAAVTADGNFLFAGNNYEFSSGNWYTFVMKTTQNGNVTFCKMSNSVPSIDPGFITELSNHDILLTGSVTLGFEEVMPIAVRFDSLGDMRWAKVFDYDIGAPQQSKFLFAKELASGNILLGGHSDYAGAANIGLMDFQVFKIDSAGTVLWMKTYGGALIDWLYGADYNEATNELLMMGTTQSYTSNNSFYGYFVSVDTAGTVTNAVVQGDTTTSGRQLILYNASKLQSGNYIFSGADMSGAANFYASKLNSGIFGPASCNSDSVSTSPLSAIYPEFIYSVTPFPLDINIQLNALPFDYYSGVGDSLLCFNNLTPVEPTVNRQQISISPNPAKDKFVITAPGQTALHISIYNLLGEEIYSTDNYVLSARGSRQFDCRLFSPGIYIVALDSVKLKLVIEK